MATIHSRTNSARSPDHVQQTGDCNADERRPGFKENDGEESVSDMGLTEMALPPPARHQDPHQPSLEATVRVASKGEPSQDAQLSEVAVPEPVSSLDRAFDEESAGDSARRRQSLEEVQKAQAEVPAQFQLSHLATELYTVSWLIFFSLWGTLARLGVEAITLYPNSPFPSRVLWANLGGSFAIGFLVEDRQLFQEEWGSPDPNAPASNHGKVKKTIPLYIGLATGFCGSFTSFSSFMRDAFLALTNALESPSPNSPYHTDPTISPRNGGFSFLALLAILIAHPAISLAALQVGAHVALVSQPLLPTIPFRFGRKILDPLAVLLGFGCWLGAVFLAIWPAGNAVHWRSRAVFPLVFAPPGCLLRFYVSKHMNARIPAFPLGTFVVNMFGTAVLGMAFDLQHASSIGATNSNSCAVLQGIMGGFCGCLTTVSTWVAELQGLRRRHAWVYGLASVGVGLALMVMIMGSMGWTVGFARPACG
jgi:CrcB protein